jgi:BCD family chlorophyll transporter-like MFS transporter
MTTKYQKAMHMWGDLAPKFLPFADAASEDLPLSRLLRLSLFQVSVGMALVLLVGTLNRVMIVELRVPSSIVSIMVAIPLLFAPFRALIGFRSDNHRSELGWRRVPYMWMGAMIQFGGLAIMPFALLVLAGAGQSAGQPPWVGQLGAAVAFLLVGAGLHTTQTVGLALANDLAAEESRPKVVGLMYVMLLVGMIISALVFGVLLADFSPGALIQVIQATAVTTLVLNVIALWKQEPRSRLRRGKPAVEPSFKEAWATLTQDSRALRTLIAVGLGTFAFSMEDVLLEPYGGQILNMSVSATTVLTATLCFGGLMGFAWASKVLSQGADPYKMARSGVLVGIPAFVAVICSGYLNAEWLFSLGVFGIGLGGGLFSHGTLTSCMNLAPKDQSGLALGAWGAVQATAAGLAMALGGVMRDLVDLLGGAATNGYVSVYAVELVVLISTAVVLSPLVRQATVPPFSSEQRT